MLCLTITMLLRRYQVPRQGAKLSHSLDYTQEEIDAHLDALFSKYEEHTLSTFGDCGFSITIAQITEK